MRVLVVDDDPDQAIIRCMLLAHHGFETRRAGNPEAALTIAREDAPEVAIVDLGLPTRDDGIRLISELKSACPQIRVVVLTGSSIQQLRDMPELCDIDGLVEKGAPCRTLLDTLERIAAARICQG